MSSRATFVFNWLRAVLKNLKKFHAEKEKTILEALRVQREQFKKRKAQIQMEMEQVLEKRREEYTSEFVELKEIERSVEETMKQLRKSIEETNGTMLNHSTTQQMPKKTKKNNEAMTILLNQNFDLLSAKKYSEEMLEELKRKRALLDDQFEDETTKIQLDYENSLNQIQQGLTLCILVENKISEFSKIIF